MFKLPKRNIVTWPVKNYKNFKIKYPWKCLWFGHVWESGWYGSVPYLTIEKGPVDNIGRHHMRLSVECSRCHSKDVIGNIHQSSIDVERREPKP